MAKNDRFFFNNSLFYVAGAVLGDGCLYKSGKYYRFVILNGDEKFAKKYEKHLKACSDSKINTFFRADQNVWWVRTNNPRLHYFLLKIKNNPWKIFEYISGIDEASLLFIEGFFDAEGCVKVVKEPVRITPKICLDATNTRLDFLEVFKCLLHCRLDILGRYSVQEAYLSKDGFPRKKSYHLRIYKKADVDKFLSNVSTTKLYKEKKKYVKNWLDRK